MGLLASEKIQHGAAIDLWGINTDYDCYQEGASISETGLEDQGSMVAAQKHLKVGAGMAS
jgi:hypothetical protein